MLTDEEYAQLGRAFATVLEDAMRSALHDDRRAAPPAVTPTNPKPENPEPEIERLRGVAPHDLAAHTQHVLQYLGGQAHVSELAPLVYSVGFKHRGKDRRPVNPDQLERSSLFQLCRRLPGKFERVGSSGVIRLVSE